MRGELDDALARLRRRDEVRQRLAANSAASGARSGDAADARASAERGTTERGTTERGTTERGTTEHGTTDNGAAARKTAAGPDPGLASNGSGSGAADAHLAAEQPAPPYQGPPPAAHSAPQPDPPAGPVPGPAVDEAISAVGEVVRRHPQIAIVVTVRDEDTFWTAHVAVGRDGQIEVATAEPRDASGSMSGVSASAEGAAAPPPAGDDGPGYVESPERAASRLADLIRRDPSLLDPPS